MYRTWSIELWYDPDSPQSGLLDYLGDVLVSVHVGYWVVGALEGGGGARNTIFFFTDIHYKK